MAVNIDAIPTNADWPKRTDDSLETLGVDLEALGITKEAVDAALRRLGISRSQQYHALVDERKACRLCSECGLINASEVRAGRFDSAQMGPWSGWLGDLHARVMVIGQDWGDQRAFEKQCGRDSPTSATNKMLIKLLAEAGIKVPAVGPSESFDVFLTNAVLCLRQKDNCSAPVRPEWVQNCGPKFLRPQIELVNPQVVVCLGARAYDAVRAAYDLPPCRDLQAAVDGRGIKLAGGPLAFAVYHCSRTGLMNRTEAEQRNDWKRIGVALAGMSNVGRWPRVP